MLLNLAKDNLDIRLYLVVNYAVDLSTQMDLITIPVIDSLEL